MTEREKMLSGALYASEDPELAAARIRARTLCGRLNQTPPEEREAQEEIIRRLFASVGENSTVNPVFWCDYGSNITAGDNFYVNYNCVILDCAPVTFGDNVFIAPTAASIPQATPWTPLPGMPGWSTPGPSPWAVTCGSEETWWYCPG